MEQKSGCNLYVCLFDFETVEFPREQSEGLVKKRGTKCFKAFGVGFVL